MRPVARWSPWLGVLLLAAPVLALPEPTPAELDHNRRLLAKWRTDPVHYARLKRDLQAFKALPPERRAALRRLDRDLHQEDPGIQARLWRVMDRYATWLERLPASDRQRIEAAADPGERLRIIRDVREREWVERLPRSRREHLAMLGPDQRANLIARFRQEERDRKVEWQRAIGPEEAPARRLLPRHVTDLPPEAQAYVNRALLPLLSAEEKEKLKKAEGQWPLFGRTLVEMVEKHPATLPGPATGPMQQKDLPEEVRKRLRQLKGKGPDRLHLFNGRWPEFAIAVTETIRQHGAMPQELGPCRPKDFSVDVQQFLEKQLLPRLDAPEKQRLTAAEGRWPEYPRALLELSRHHGLRVPAPAPGPRDFWERLRAATLANDKVTG